MTQAEFNRMGWQIYGNRWPQVARTVPQMRGCMGLSWSDVTGFVTGAGKTALDIYGSAKQGEAYKDISSQLIASKSDTTKTVLTVAAVAGVGLLAFKLLSK